MEIIVRRLHRGRLSKHSWTQFFCTNIFNPQKMNGLQKTVFRVLRFSTCYAFVPFWMRVKDENQHSRVCFKQWICNIKSLHFFIPENLKAKTFHAKIFVFTCIFAPNFVVFYKKLTLIFNVWCRGFVYNAESRIGGHVKESSTKSYKIFCLLRKNNLCDIRASDL